MAADINLCSRCRSIDFESLFYGHPDDLCAIRYSYSRDPGADALWLSENKDIPLGLLASAVRRRGSCDLCAFISERACHVLKRELGGNSDTVTDTDSNSDKSDSNTETISGGCSPVSTVLSTSEVELSTSEVELSTSDSTRMPDLYFSRSQEETASDGVPYAESTAIDVNSKPFELPLRRDGQSITCIIGRSDFGKLVHTYWKGRPVDELFIRKLSVSFGYKSYPMDPRLQLCVDETVSSLPTKGTGREVADMVDLGLVKGWIETCRSRHGDGCEMPRWLDKAELAPGFRVIDVVGKRVVLAAPGCRYLALSYVWGESALARTATALKSNISRLGEEGGLACLPLPGTIRDALELTEKLGEQYLWVDALCIVQDDIEDVQRQTAAMDSVFSGAALTIAAAAGHGAEAGLPGLTPGSRRNTRRKIRVTEELSLLSTVEGELERSTWRRRGWTFQEQLLSRRMLFFTQNLVLWKCDHDVWSEETILEPEEPNGSFMAPADGVGQVYALTSDRFAKWKYEQHVMDYSARTLSYGSDILPAFQGVMHRYEVVTGERLHWGLPYRIVDMGTSLMWSGPALAGSERQDLRRLRLDDGTAIHMLYPSWSWMGWNREAYRPGRCWGGLRTCGPDFIQPELDFYKLMSDGRVELLAPREPPTADNAGHCSARPLTRHWKGPTAVDGLVLTASDRGGLVQEVVPAQPGGRIPVYDTGRLIFWTSHARIRTWSVGDYLEGFDLHVQLPGRVSQADDGLYTVARRLYYEMAPSTSKRLFGSSHATRGRGDAAASRLLSYVVELQEFRN